MAKEQSELNRKLIEAIDKAIDESEPASDYLSIQEVVANECERICLQDKINLLDEISHANTEKGFTDKLLSIRQHFQEQLTQLK